MAEAAGKLPELDMPQTPADLAELTPIVSWLGIKCCLDSSNISHLMEPAGTV